MISLEKIDPNFQVPTDITEPDIIWLNARQTPSFSLHGIFYDEKQKCYLRMPPEVAAAASEHLQELNDCTAGGRIRFRTNSSFIGIKAVMRNRTPMKHMPRTGQSGFDLYRKTTATPRDTYYHTYVPPVEMKEGFTAPFTTDGKMAEYTLNFPLYDGVDDLYIALKKDAVLEAPAPYAHPLPVLYYGSSITQGGCASRPGNSYQAILSRMLDVDHINLGFSGSAKAEASIVTYLAAQPMSVFVCDYDHNAPNPEHLQKTHLPLYRAVRAAQPNLPIILISAPDGLLWAEKYSGRRDIVKATYEIARSEGDPNISFIDGATLFAGDNWDACTVDGCHPNDLGFYRMATVIGQELKKYI